MAHYSARNPRRILIGVLLLTVLPLLLVLPQALDTCRAGSAFKANARLWTADTCRSDEDCKASCPQGDSCMPKDWAYRLAGRNQSVCACRSRVAASCSTAADCPVSMLDSWQCPHAWTWSCTYYPKSTEGTCACQRAPLCATALDCPSDPDCPDGRVCGHRDGLDAGICECPSGVRDIRDGGP
jgi:hypothetical protein